MANEKHTRKEIIDQRLKAAGWNVNDRTQVIEEYEVQVSSPNEVAEPLAPYQSKQFSDYVLLGKDGKPLAVVEAKKTSVDARIGEEQAKQYVYNNQKQYKCELPFCIYTNGNDIYLWDLGKYSPRKIYGFPTRSDLERMAFIRKNQKRLADELLIQKLSSDHFKYRPFEQFLKHWKQERGSFY